MKGLFIKIIFGVNIFLISLFSYSQELDKKHNKKDIYKDSIPKLKYNFKHNQQGGLFLKNPSETSVIFDKNLNKFVFKEKIGNYIIKTPIFMNKKQYDSYRLKNDMKKYFKDKISANNGKIGNKIRRNLLPKYYVNYKFFESIFGGNELEVNPSGQISVKLGAIYQNTENPQISIENQSSVTFDFDQQISTILQAKVGKRLKISANYDTQSTFDFQNLIKLQYTPDEDDILQKLDAGNINLPIKNSLINGAQALFGVRADLKFGKTTIRTALSQQNSQTKQVVAKGGAVIEEFELRATDYDNDRHFFLSQFFRETFSSALKNYPLISSPINITRIEVWVTNLNQNVKDYRSIVAFSDLGESKPINLVDKSLVINNNTAKAKIGGNSVNLPYNEVNNISNLLSVSSGGIRNISSLESTIKTISPNAQQGQNYSYLQNARKLQNNEYVLHPQLGYISLNRRLNDGEVLAVSYEYTIVGASNGKTSFKVGEFSNDGINPPSNIAVKLLRSEILTTSRTIGAKKFAFPTWNLMMKNIYPIGAFDLNQDGFRFEIMYRNDDTGVLLNSLQEASESNLKNKTLLKVFNLDRLDQSQFVIAGGDGFFDFVEGITVNSNKGYIIFPETEPFGNYLDKVLKNPNDKKKYTFKELYLTTKIQAKNEYQNKDKFFLKGYYKSKTSRGISLGAFNIPRGSVVVSAGGKQLLENIDYVVDYQLGRVQILDPGIEASGIPINARVENNTFFNQQRKSFIGIDVEHRINDNFVLGGTFLNVTEKPMTPKINFGGEPIDNKMFGLNIDYSTKINFFTKLANKLPFVDTDVPSNLSIRADMAYLLPGSPSGIDINGKATSYLDDFEASQIPISLNSPQQWYLSSTPISQGYNGNSYNLDYNDKRAKISWYNVDQLFYSSSGNKPKNINEIELSRDEIRRINYSELFPNTDLDITQLNLVRTLDLAYYPQERGPYNFNTSSDVNKDGKFINPEKNWGGIMRSLNTNNFEQSNVEYIQFWLLDPYENYSIKENEGFPTNKNPKDSNNHGKLLINLGNLSEDILRDSRKQYENGLSTTSNPSPETITKWGKVPINQSIFYAFSNNNNDRKQQDVGLDGLNFEEETKYVKKLHDSLGIDLSKLNKLDPSGDNFQFFRSAKYDSENASILTRYKNYNGTEGNSPTPEQTDKSYPISSTTYPDTEDINKDQTMNTVSAYYEYEISMKKNDLIKGQNHIVDTKETTITLADGKTRKVKWYQFRIPVKTGYTNVVGGITDFNSIRFIRMFLTGFKIPVVLRFGELELVRGDWRRYTKTLNPNITQQNLKDIGQLNNFEVGVVSKEQNQNTYAMPPGIRRERLQGTNRVQRQNEQSTTLKVTNLPPNSTRAVYKNISIDMRRYKKLKMFLHAQDPKQLSNPTQEKEVSAIIRFGTDLNDNYYQIEKKLIYSKQSNSSTEVWPEENNLDIIIEELTSLKLERDGITGNSPSSIFSGISSNGLKIKVKGNPTLAQIRTVMLGLKNTSSTNKSAEVWFNELRVVGFDNKGGCAAVLNADTNFADIADVSLVGRVSSVGFGDVENRVQERSIEQIKQYNINTSVKLGKMLPKKWHIQIPMNFNYGQEIRNPKYNPLYQDITQEKALKSGNKQVIKNAENAKNFTRRKGISFINVKKNKNPSRKKRPKFYDVENFSFSYAYNEEFHKDYNIKKYLNQNVMAGGNYTFNFKPWIINPFKKIKNKYWKLIKDINFNPIPKTFSIISKYTRNYNSQQSRNLVKGFSDQPELIERKFMFDWNYSLGFDLTKSLKLNFNTTNNHIYDNKGEKLEVFDNFFTIGRPNHYHQNLISTYKLPINKIPFLNFLTTNYSYNAYFDWKSNSQSPEVRNKIGNMIQNSNEHIINSNINFDILYKTIGLKKLLLKNKKNNTNTSNINPKLKKNASFSQKFFKLTYDILTSIKRASINYSKNNGTLLEGYKPTVDLFGLDRYGGSYAPSVGFVLGSQKDIINKSIQNNWLITRISNEEYFNKTYSKTSSSKLDYNISVRPFKNFMIDFRGNKIKTNNLTQQLDIIDIGNNNYKLNKNLQFFNTGNYSISHYMLATAFTSSDKNYKNFLNYRSIISDRLSKQTKLPNSSNVNSPGYKINGQQSMLPAFISAYSGFNPHSTSTNIFRNIPIPNWTIRFNGLMKYKWFKKNFSSFTLYHGYESSFTINNYTNNLKFNPNNLGLTNISKNYQPKTLISQASLIDQFSPLIRINMKMRNSLSFKAEIKKDRNLTLNFNNNTLTDINGTEFILGFGYKIRDVKFVTRFTGKKKTIKGDINLRSNMSLRKNLTLIRSIDKQNDQITGGENLFSLNFIADYNLSENLTASFYYNHNTFRYAISTTVPRQSINAGINIIYSLGN